MLLYILKIRDKNIIKIGITGGSSRVNHLIKLYNVTKKGSYLVYGNSKRTIIILEQYLLNLTRNYKLKNQEIKDGYTELRDSECINMCLNEINKMNNELELSIYSLGNVRFLRNSIELDKDIKTERYELIKSIVNKCYDVVITSDGKVYDKNLKPKKEMLVGGSYGYIVDGKFRTKKWIRNNCTNVLGFIYND